MAHIHSVYDSDTHFSIDPITRKMKNESSAKTNLIQYDKNSERFTFDLPREIEGHDMAECNLVQVHYINIDSKTKEQNEDVYTVDDFQISPSDEDVVICSWLISGNATQLVGPLVFLIRFSCIDEAGAVQYAWNTATYTAFSISEGMNNGEAIVQEYPDVLAQFEARIANLEKNGVGGGGTVIDPESVNQAQEAAQAAAESASQAASSAETAESSASAAQTAKEGAETARETAAQQATNAGNAAQEATTAATGAAEAKAAAEKAASDALAQKEAAANARQAAETAKSGAEQAATNASASAGTAGESATAAQNAAQSAGSAKESAETAKNAAESARDEAGQQATTAAFAAQTAATAAENAEKAQAAAETAANTATSAKTAAESARDQANQSATAAAGSATTASNAATAAQTAQGKAETAQAAAESAKSTASQKATEATNAAQTATSKATEASQSATSAGTAKTAAEEAAARAEAAADRLLGVAVVGRVETINGTPALVLTGVQEVADYTAYYKVVDEEGNETLVEIGQLVPKDETEPDPVTYTITWVVDGKTTTETYEEGETPTFKGSTDKAADDEYTYTFAGWSPDIEAVKADATYTAQYTQTAKPTEPAYDNLLTAAGYDTGKKVSTSSGNVTDVADACVSGLINIKGAKTVRIKNVTFSQTGNINNIVFYKTENSEVVKANAWVGQTGRFNNQVKENNGVYEFSPNDSAVEYFRFSCAVISDDTIVTVDQKI